MKRFLHLVTVALLLLSVGCGSSQELTESGKGYPIPSIEFPETSAPGSVQKAVLTVKNPGPGDINALLVTFVLAAPASPGENFPVPLLNGGPNGKDPNVLSITPKPIAVDRTGINYRFGALPEGGETTITFEIRVPDKIGPAGNSVTVSDGEEIQRARGVRLETRVQG